MYNKNSSEHKGYGAPPPMSPRISFSNDFAESSSHHSHIRGANYRDAPVSSDFEFSVSNYSMMSADELFSKGKLLPFKENCRKTTTLRDELQNEEDGEFTSRPPKNPTRWRGFLGLKKSQSGLRKTDKGGQSSRATVDFNHEDNVQCNRNSKDSTE